MNAPNTLAAAESSQATAWQRLGGEKKLMTKYIIVLTSIFMATTCFAQQNRLSLNLNSLSGIDINHEVDTTIKSTNSGMIFTPTISYYRIFTKGTGLGITLGYTIQKGDYENSFEPSKGDKAIRYSSDRASAIYFQPTAFEQIDKDKYLFIFSVNVPVKYYLKATAEEFYQETTQNVPTYTGEAFITHPKQLEVGVNFGGGIHRKLGKSFMIGAEINVGMTGLIRYGKRIEEIIQTQNNLTYETLTETIIKKEFNYRFGFSPLLSLSYQF